MSIGEDFEEFVNKEKGYKELPLSRKPELSKSERVEGLNKEKGLNKPSWMDSKKIKVIRDKPLKPLGYSNIKKLTKRLTSQNYGKLSRHIRTTAKHIQERKNATRSRRSEARERGVWPDY